MITMDKNEVMKNPRAMELVEKSHAWRNFYEKATAEDWRSLEEIANLIAKAFKEKELLKIGNRSYVNAFKSPESRFDVKDLRPNGGSALKSGMLQPLRDPAKIFTDQVIIPPGELVFLLDNKAYVKCGSPVRAGWISGGLTDHAKVIQPAIGVGKGTFIKTGVYKLNAGLEVVGTGTPPLGVETTAKTCVIQGEGRWNTVLQAEVDMNILELSNALSIKLEDLYFNMNNKAGYPIRGLGTGVSDRCLMRSEMNNIEIHGVTADYYAMYLTNPYFINNFDLFFIRSAGGGILLDCDAVGYGNQHFKNFFISLYTANKIGIYLRNAGFSIGESTFERIHIDGGGASGTVGVQLFGSTYSKFPYLRCESISIAVRIEAGILSAMNLFSGGFQRCDTTVFDFDTTSSRGNHVHNVCCSAIGSGVMLIKDGCNGPSEPDVFRDLTGYSAGFAAVPVTRYGLNCCRLYGTILNKRGEDGFSATIPNGASYVDVTHGLIFAPQWVIAIGTETETRQLTISNVGATTFRINAPANVTADRTVYWRAGVNRP